jgi:hypothetical protein
MSHVVDLEKDSVVADADAEESFVAGHRLDTVRPRVLLESEEMRVETPSDCEGKPEEFALS